MPHREHVDAPEKQPSLTYLVAGWMTPQYLAWKDQSAVVAGPSRTRQVINPGSVSSLVLLLCQWHWHIILTSSAPAICPGMSSTPTTCTQTCLMHSG